MGKKSRFAIEVSIKSVDKITGPMTRTRRRLTRSLAAIGRGVTKVTKLTGKMARGFLKAGAGLVKFGGIGTGVGLGAVTMLNQSTVEAGMLSKALDVSVDTIEGLAAAIKGAGFNLDNVVDLVEEMNNKFGESAGLAQTLPVQEAMKLLGLQFRDIRKLKPEEQFLKIGNAILKTKDHAKALSAADILFGGEANKVFGSLRAVGGSMEDIIGKYKELNFQTEDSRRGAGVFTRSLGRAVTIITTLGKFIAGLVGEAITPLLEQLQEWVLANKEVIKTGIIEFIPKFVAAVKSAAKVVKEFSAENNIGSTLVDILKDSGKLISLASTVATGIKNVFLTVGTFIGETIAKIMLGVEAVQKFLGSDAPAGTVAKGLGSGGGAMGLVGGVGAALLQGAISSPQERSAKILQESKTLDQTEVTIKDESGRAEVTRGGNGGNFTLSSGAF